MSVIKSYSVGNGDMFFIDHNSDNFTIIDCCLEEDIVDDILNDVQLRTVTKNIVRFISTHPDEDHILGLKEIDSRLKLLNFYCVKNATTKDDESPDFNHYRELRDSSKAFHLSKGCQRKWMNLSSEERGAAGINVLWPDTSDENFKDALEIAENGGGPNNISPIIEYRINDGLKALWMGDLETDFMELIEDKISLPKVDILFAPHHGRDSGKIPESWLKVMDPKIIVIGEAPFSELNYYKGYNTITQNTAGNITFECIPGKVHVFVSNDDYEVDFLSTDSDFMEYKDNYLGTLEL